jgi:hypothetical protein
MPVNRSTMPVSRARMAGNLPGTLPVCSARVLCTIACQAQYAFALGVPLQRMQLRRPVVRFRNHRGRDQPCHEHDLTGHVIRRRHACCCHCAAKRVRAAARRVNEPPRDTPRDSFTFRDIDRYPPRL